MRTKRQVYLMLGHTADGPARGARYEGQPKAYSRPELDSTAFYLTCDGEDCGQTAIVRLESVAEMKQFKQMFYRLSTILLVLALFTGWAAVSGDLPTLVVIIVAVCSAVLLAGSLILASVALAHSGRDIPEPPPNHRIFVRNTPNL